MNEYSQFVDQPTSAEDCTPVPVARTGAKVLVSRRDGGSVDGFARVFAEVRERISEADAGTIADHWAAIGPLSPCGVAPLVRIQPERPGRVPLPSDEREFTRGLDRAEKRFFAAEPVTEENLRRWNSKVINDLVVRSEYFHRGAVVIFVPSLVDVDGDAELSWHVARWLASMYVESVGLEKAARRWELSGWPMSTTCGYCMKWLDQEHDAGSQDLAPVRTRLLANECWLRLSYEWAGREFDQ